MKRLCHGIQSTRRNAPVPVDSPRVSAPPLPIVPPPEWRPLPDHFDLPPGVGPNMIPARVLLWSLCRQKVGRCLQRSDRVLPLVVYHYEANAILATPISGLDDKSIFNAYKKNFDELTSKGFKPKLNVMDNQATRYIKIFLTEENLSLLQTCTRRWQLFLQGDRILIPSIS